MGLRPDCSRPFLQLGKAGWMFSKIKTGIQTVLDESFWDCKVCKSLEGFEKILMFWWFYECCSQTSWHRDEGSWSWQTVPTLLLLPFYHTSAVTFSFNHNVRSKYQMVSMFPVPKHLDDLLNFLSILHRHTNLRWNIRPCCKHVNHCTRQRIRTDSSSPNKFRTLNFKYLRLWSIWYLIFQ